MILVDTDVLIWNLRGNSHAAEVLDGSTGSLALSAVSYMELVQGMRNGAELRALREALLFWQARLIQIAEPVSMRASYLMEEHALAGGLRLADALIAATALEQACVLLTGNDRHFSSISGLEVRAFRP